MDAAVVILDSPQKISASLRSYERPGSDGEDDATISGDFSFSFSFPSSTTARDLSAAVADDIFSDGRILPIFDPTLASAPRTRAPLWKLMMDPSPTRSLSWSSDFSSDLEAEGECCIWPPPEMRLKSSFTASTSSRRCRLALLLARCHSLGSDRFFFLHPTTTGDENPNPNPNPKKNPAAAEGLNLGATGEAEMDMATAHRFYYVKGSNRRVTGSRRSPVPYKPFGLLVNINGMFRSRLPV